MNSMSKSIRWTPSRRKSIFASSPKAVAGEAAEKVVAVPAGSEEAVAEKAVAVMIGDPVPAGKVDPASQRGVPGIRGAPEALELKAISQRLVVRRKTGNPGRMMAAILKEVLQKVPRGIQPKHRRRNGARRIQGGGVRSRERNLSRDLGI